MSYFTKYYEMIQINPETGLPEYKESEKDFYNRISFLPIRLKNDEIRSRRETFYCVLKPMLEKVMTRNIRKSTAESIMVRVTSPEGFDGQYAY